MPAALRFASACTLLGVIAFVPSAIPIPAAAETLQDVLADAYNGNARIQAERFQLRQTDEGVPQALAGWRPTVELEASAARVHQYFTFVPPPTQTFNDTRTAVQVVQPIWHGGSTSADVARAEAAVEAGRAQLAGVEADRLLAAALAYLDVFRDMSIVELNRRLEQVLAVNRANVEATFKAGAATETDLVQAAARLSGATAGRHAAESALATSNAIFTAVVGRAPLGLAAPGALGHIPDDLDRAVDNALQANPGLAAAKARVDAAAQAVEVERGRLLPRIDAVGSLDHENGVFADRKQLNDARLGVQATMPLYEAGGVYAEVRAAREAVSQARRDVVETERTVRQDVTSAWHALETARAEQQNFRDQIRANQVALTDTEKEVTVGTRTRLDTLNAEQELFLSQVDLVGAEHDALAATFRLEAAMGVFTPRDLALGVTPYDPAAHLAAVRDKWVGTAPPP